VSRPIAYSFGDLTSSEWFHVATRVRCGGEDVWNWHLSATDRDALLLARDIGHTALTAHEHGADGVVRLVARLTGAGSSRGNGARKPSERFLGGSEDLPDPNRLEGVARPLGAVPGVERRGVNSRRALDWAAAQEDIERAFAIGRADALARAAGDLPG
jgi:hypothetical protein